MDRLLSLILAAVLFLALDYLWRRPWPSRRQEPSEPRSEPESCPPAPPLSLDPAPIEALRVQRRLSALAAELQRLEKDPGVYAKAHHTRAVQAAYAALLEDAARLATTSSVEVETPRTFRPAREEIDV